MAKIKWGMMVTDGRGKLGGHVLSKNRSGAYVRTKVTPVNPQTSFQSEVRAFFALLSQAWSSLTPAQILAWNDAVELFKRTDIFGDLKSLTGKALFQSLNQNLLVAEENIINDAPLPEEVPQIVGFTAVASVAGTSFDLTTSGDTTGAVLIIRATPPLSAGTSFVKNRLRKIAIAAGGNDVAPDVWADYVARFGAPTQGENIHVAIHSVNAVGQASPEVIVKATIGA